MRRPTSSRFATRASSVLTRALLRRGEFTSRAELAEKTTDFAVRYNQTAHPWTRSYDARADHARYLARLAEHKSPVEPLGATPLRPVA